MVSAVFPEVAGGKFPVGTRWLINFVVRSQFKDQYYVHVADDDTKGEDADDDSDIADADNYTEIYNANSNTEVADEDDNLRGGCG